MLEKNPQRQTSAFTLVELLVVIAIIGILVALLLPSVQAAREAARRTQCLSNLKQIGIALHNYHDTNGAFPAGMWFDRANTAPNSTRFKTNWIIAVLPFFEEQTLYDSFDLTSYISEEINRPARGTIIPTLLCPTDNGAETFFRGITRAEGDNWARGNYACNGDNERSDRTTDDPQKVGVMRINEETKMAQILDGTSHTILVAEIRIGLTEIDRRGVWAMGASGASNLTWHGFGGDCNGPNPSNDSSDDILGCSNLHRQVGVQTLREERMTCWEPCPSYQAAPRSSHPAGGVHLVMCDGSARWVGDDINTSGAWGGCCSVWDRMLASQDGLPFEID